jgi:hypothetical protein
MSNEGNKIHNFYTVLTFVIPFYYGSGTVIIYGSDSVSVDYYYGSGSAKAKIYGSGSATLILT